MTSALDQLLRRLDHPMLLVTAADGHTASGCLVGFHTQCSIEPVRHLVLLSVANRTYRLAREASHLGVHVLARTDRDLGVHFGTRTGDDTDKFATIGWHPGRGGAPMIERCRNRFVGRVVDRVPGGDHVGFVVEPVAVETHLDGFVQLDASTMRGLDPGHEP